MLPILCCVSLRALLASLEIAAGDRLALAMGSGDGDTKHTLDSHCMTTGPPIGEEAARTMPFPFMEGCDVGVILTTEGRFKVIELNALWLFCVALRLRNFADHTGMHGGHLLGRLVGFACKQKHPWMSHNIHR